MKIQNPKSKIQNNTEPALRSDDLTFFQQNGYVVIPNAVPQENLDAVIAAIWDYLDMNPDDPDDWYRHPHRPTGMVEMYHHQTLWDNRQYPRLYEAFVQIWGTPKLWVSLDRTCMKPPRHPDHPDYDHKGFIHWDLDTFQTPMPFMVQGVLYLTDTEADQGGFQCVPETYRQLQDWLQTQPPGQDLTPPELPGGKVIPIPGKAGDLLIWNSLLPHGNGHNVSRRPRLAQYITMYPAPEDDQAQYSRSVWDSEQDREERIAGWRDRTPPRWAWGVAVRETERGTTEPARLSPLGRRLLGLDRWEKAEG